MSLRRSITVGIAGGSGAVYAHRLLQLLPRYYERVDVVISDAGRQVFLQELEVEVPKPGVWKLEGAAEGGTITLWGTRNYNAPFASGSNCAEEMIILPCSMSTVASIAHGIDQNVMHHAAGVTIKEGKRLILVPRETPLSAIHLRNMLTLAELGVVMIAAMPGFYGGQQTFDDLINFVLQKIANQLHLPLRLARRWGEEQEETKSEE